MEVWKEVRRRVLTKEISGRAACAEYHLGWKTLNKDPDARRAAGLSLEQAGTEAGVGAVPAAPAPVPGRRPAGTEEAAAHGPPDFRAAAGRASLSGRRDRGEGRGAGLEAVAPRSLLAPLASAGRGPGRFRRSDEPSRTIVGVRSVEQSEQFRKLLPQARRIGLIATPAEIERYAATGVAWIRLWPNWLSDDTLVERVRKAGAGLHLNGETGTLEELSLLLKCRPDSVSGDDPARIVATLKQLRRASRKNAD
jgi:hypothetical protein